MHAGNNFCGTVPDEFDGTVRNYVGVEGAYQVLANVTAFDATCDPDHTGAINSAEFAATLGRCIHYKTRCLTIYVMQLCRTIIATALLCVPLCQNSLHLDNPMAEHAQSLTAACKDLTDCPDAMRKSLPILFTRQHSQVHATYILLNCTTIIVEC